MTAYEDDLIELEEIKINGRFIDETETHWIYQEEEVEEPQIWHIEKKQLKGKPPLNHYGYLILDDSYFPKQIEGKWYITEGLGYLITFNPIPF